MPSFDRLRIIEFVVATRPRRSSARSEGGVPVAPDLAAIRAGRLMLTRIHEIAAARRSFGFETTLAGKGYVNLLERFRGDTKGCKSKEEKGHSGAGLACYDPGGE